ncbi:MAG: hypothetical protein IPJ98_21630 [Bryobacterales bacterium]|nr:hypothetical protein [Bryobacterales bacterium]
MRGPEPSPGAMTIWALRERGRKRAARMRPPVGAMRVASNCVPVVWRNQ